MMRADHLRLSKPSPLSLSIPHLRSLSRSIRLKIRSKASFPSRRSSLGNLNLRRSNLLPFQSKPNFQINAEDGCYGGLEIAADEFLELGDMDLPVELSVTRALPPALTLREGFDKIKEAIEKLKANPPCLRSGVLRIQVAVPPSTKALNWLCCQCKELSVFPQFYFLARQTREQSLELASLNGMVEVSGIGTAIYVHGSSHTRKGCNLIARYLSVDSPLIRAYGFIGIHYNKESFMMEDGAGSFFFFIPQIELNEFEGFSLLASTLIWDDFVSYTFERAVHTFELYFHQIIQYIHPIGTYVKDMWMNYFYGLSNLMEHKHVQMVFLNAEILVRIDAGANNLLQEDSPSCCRYYFRHSSTASFGSNMLMDSRGTNCLIKECANINYLWASLIIEECVRLGLTYFCIAPGSRSSPLAISACGHSLTTCISCFDERSLAFHAVGYARGSLKPAVVITSSGTAVSNLLPAVVEASHDCVPLMLLTADRPPELQDVGANQAIDQVNHFGKFVRFFFSFPPPTDQIPARMVLTTVDSAAYSATQAPYGPVHINCPLREPLEDCPKEWSINCLRGLDLWLSNAGPYTRYIKMQHCCSCNGYSGQVAEVLEVIQRAKQGLLLIGAIHTEDEIWAALLLAKHLFWPVVTDILSGLRLRRLFTSFTEIEDRFYFIDHLDNALLSNAVKGWAQPDVILQIGSRITSKRIVQLLEFCSPSAYILVDKHPYRHDPSHIVTHRIQSTISEFADIILKIYIMRKPRKWSSFLKTLDMVVAWEIAFQIHSECSLTEPHVAHIIGEVLQDDVVLFVGNSMVIRDVDMYGRGWVKSVMKNTHLMSDCDLQFHGIQVAGNRGASGIDGLLSTAIGFAVGCNKRVICVIGDISFLHDTNGLAILNQRARRKPMTILVINNHGGAIFSLLPIADRALPNVLNQYFYTAHDVSISKLCAAHSVKHLLARTKMELHNALWRSQNEQTDCVIEVESNIADNAKFHSMISQSAYQAANQVLDFLIRFPNSESVKNGLFVSKIHKMEFSLYRIQLCAPLASSQLRNDRNKLYHEGFILNITLDDSSSGFGEVAPIEIHEEDLLDVEEQLRFLVHKLEGSEISYFLPLLRGSFSHWIWRSLGVPPSSIFPSVRNGMEMAILNALAARAGSSLLELVTGCRSSLQDSQSLKDIMKGSARIEISALVDCNGTPKQVAHVVSRLVDEGFTTIKLKVARRENLIEDVAVIQEIREMVGYKINIRVDANRKWTYEEAVEFGSGVKYFDIQYIEEPVCLEDDIIKFCQESCLPVALDETIDNLKGDFLNKLQNFVYPGIVAIVIKPSVVGGFENAALIAKWAQLHDKMAVVSASFESSLSLSAYIQFAYFLEQQNITICRLRKRKLSAAIAHGLGTYQWLKEDVSTNHLEFHVAPNGDKMEASVKNADTFLRYFQIKDKTVQRIYTGEQLKSYRIEVNGDNFSCSFKLQEAGVDTKKQVVIYLHGFLGASQDWVPIMKAISPAARCISIDLPGHGESQVQWHMDKSSKQKLNISVESVADIIMKLICDITSGGVILIGYSMGARIALYMTLKYNEKINGAVIISGSPGLRDEAARRIRSAQDEARAHFLLAHGLQDFLHIWYAGSLWKSLRDHPHFNEIVRNRAKHSDIQALAKVLSDLSIGKQMSLWEDLKHCQKPLLFIAGDKDIKFRDISKQMCSEIRTCSEGKDHIPREQLSKVVIVPDCGHAVHLENPLPVINAVRKFITNFDKL
ncbi:protein PHYLLO, chloroplastic isoform X3 [Phoenix dactylifera]|uniref:Protein PHYLLO, chloroplastic isoform X3 n=1 Tax=Phoenix dactylifera TaxID=42345 RepID=A0A8B9AMR3_PHODC|nr:protein PHYLLO, chloroplastic isoform X3 [Phoenix dactylifera]